MILFDTSVVIDARDAASPFHDWAKLQIAKAVATEGAAVNTVVISEAGVRAEKRENLDRHLENLGITLLPLPVSSALPAARAYALYLDRLKAEGKNARSKIPMGDFFIGAHAEAEGMKLVTRDPARVQKYFPNVTLVQPVLS
jgi:predicted nucleic acid-binding protein